MLISTLSDSKALCLTGAIEIYEAEPIRQALMEALASRTELVFDLGRVESCDTAGAQLLWSTRLSAEKAGKPIRFENVPQPVAEFWDKLGFPANFFANQD